MSGRQKLIELCLIEPYDKLVVNINDRYRHLSGLFYHFLGFIPVRGNIMFGKGDALLRKILLRMRAMGSGWGGINCDFLVAHVTPPLINLIFAPGNMSREPLRRFYAIMVAYLTLLSPAAGPQKEFRAATGWRGCIKREGSPPPL